MKCLYPKIIVRKDVPVPKDIYKMRSVPGYVERNPQFFQVARCGKCYECRHSNSRMWSARLLYESDYWSKASFISLDYAPDYLPMLPEKPLDLSDFEYYGTLRQSEYNFGSTLVRRAVPDFMKRVRSAFKRENGRLLNCKYYYVGEYGDKFGRPHYHIIMFGLDLTDRDLLERCWTFGQVKIDPVNLKTIQYVTQYVHKKLNGPLGQEVYGARVHPFGQGSNGLGFRFFCDNMKKFYQDKMATLNGHKIAVPRYFLKKDEDLKELICPSNPEVSPTLLEYLEQGSEEFYKQADLRTVDNVRRIQTHTKHSVF